MFLVSSLFSFVWFPCGRLSWLHVSFWAHVNIVHHIISYHIIKGIYRAQDRPVVTNALDCAASPSYFSSGLKSRVEMLRHFLWGSWVPI